MSLRSSSCKRSASRNRTFYIQNRVYSHFALTLQTDRWLSSLATYTPSLNSRRRQVAKK